ncbi:hypothetical protein JIX56_06940 [Streptomyces sp. CA-210063]|uniref:hypothetical protein n=1 Tax=Streptomyces sp. CA-210063 TaxID=2801029 RepID=UPI00214B92DC|nr:hypothetical protein [Streptomyces sp. CA-210063]UUU29642.1 hypothetical protein JIX56_06940 [Streptomyces sp. CA-210063]
MSRDRVTEISATSPTVDVGEATALCPHHDQPPHRVRAGRRRRRKTRKKTVKGD